MRRASSLRVGSWALAFPAPVGRRAAGAVQ